LSRLAFSLEGRGFHAFPGDSLGVFVLLCDIDILLSFGAYVHFFFPRSSPFSPKSFFSRRMFFLLSEQNSPPKPVRRTYFFGIRSCTDAFVLSQFRVLIPSSSLQFLLVSLLISFFSLPSYCFFDPCVCRLHPLGFFHPLRFLTTVFFQGFLERRDFPSSITLGVLLLSSFSLSFYS